MDLKRVDDCKRKLEDWYGVTLSDDLGKMFVKFCIENFQGIAQVERATDLLIQNEPNYGRMPAFKRMKDLFSEYMQPQQRPEYQVVDASTFALPPAKERGVNERDWTPLTSEEIATARWGTKHPVIERLKAKVHVSQFFKSQAALPHGQRYREEAIAEANARNIPLDLIGVKATVAA
jgi:hypothetical protein